MASGGSGDCLTGILTAPLRTRDEGNDAARLGTYWHGLAGDLALQEQGGPSVLATDLIEQLPRALNIISSSPTATLMRPHDEAIARILGPTPKRREGHSLIHR